MHPIDRLSQKGFTLMEIMVAMMILALSLTVVLQLFSGGLRSGQLSKTYLLAVYHARAKMEEALLREALVDDVQQGEIAEGYTWKTTVQQERTETPANNSSGLLLFNITVTITWRDGGHQKSYTVESLRLGHTIAKGSS